VKFDLGGELKKKGLTISPDILSASIPILAIETESVEVEFDVEGETG